MAGECSTADFIREAGTGRVIGLSNGAEKVYFDGFSPGGGGAGVAVAFSAAIPLDGNKYMTPTPQDIVSATAFSVSGTPVIGGQCTVKLAANGVITPTFTGMTEWGGSAGWNATAGAINTIVFWFDGWTTYYAITQNSNAPITVPVPSAAVKSGTVAPSQLDITLTAAINTGAVPEASKFALVTANGGAQVDTVTGVSLPNSTTVRLVTNRAATPGDVTSVSYDPTRGLLAQRMVDVAGNLLFAWSNMSVAVQSFIGILDGFGQTSSFALSVNRRLRTGYVGPIIRVSTSATGGTTTDISAGPDGTITGLPGGSVYLDRLYDQSGFARDFTFIGGTSRPLLTAITVGAFTRYSVMPSNSLFTASMPPEGGLISAASGSSFAGVFCVVDGAGGSGQGRSLLNTAAGTMRILGIAGNFTLNAAFTNVEPNYASAAFSSLTVLRQVDRIRNGANQNARVDGAALAAITTGVGNQYAGVTTPATVSLFQDNGGSANAQWDGRFAEMIWFADALTNGNRDTLAANQRAHWGTA
jgi:hypothetical protein